METSELKKVTSKNSIVYGPVHSRRLGHSLGLNIAPVHKKRCSFDCVYCECGSARPYQEAAESGLWPSPIEIEKALIVAFEKGFTADYITFAGNGEPTLHPQFADIVERVRRVRDFFAPTLEIALLSNSSLIWKETIQAVVALIDVPILKLDAGDEEIFQNINRPATGITLEKIIQGLKTLRGYFIQSLFLDGVISNIGDKSVELWIENIAELKPQGVQIYTLDRTTPISGLIAVSRQKLETIAVQFRKQTHVAVSVYGPV